MRSSVRATSCRAGFQNEAAHVCPDSRQRLSAAPIHISKDCLRHVQLHLASIEKSTHSQFEMLSASLQALLLQMLCGHAGLWRWQFATRVEGLCHEMNCRDLALVIRTLFSNEAGKPVAPVLHIAEKHGDT